VTTFKLEQTIGRDFKERCPPLGRVIATFQKRRVYHTTGRKGKTRQEKIITNCLKKGLEGIVLSREISRNEKKISRLEVIITCWFVNLGGGVALALQLQTGSTSIGKVTWEAGRIKL